jgi:hypothetical protein
MTLTLNARLEETPYLVRFCGRIRPRTTSGYALPRPLAPHLKLGLAPRPMRTPAAHLVTIAPEEDRNPQESVARIVEL